jgi:hypothetical protein
MGHQRGVVGGRGGRGGGGYDNVMVPTKNRGRDHALKDQWRNEETREDQHRVDVVSKLLDRKRSDVQGRVQLLPQPKLSLIIY